MTASRPTSVVAAGRSALAPSARRRPAATVLLVLAATACASAAPAPRTTPPPAAQASGDQAAIARARADSARYPYTAADIHFMTAMIAHHAQAIQMARLAPSHGASEQVQVLAARIVNAQRDEIATMQRWLADRLQPVPQVDSTGVVAGASSHAGHHALMQGMLTPAQLQQLAAARGAEFDQLFLRYMIQHHRGAVAMVEELFRTDGAAQDEGVFRLASDVNVDQITEIGRMERMLLALIIERRTP